MVKVPGYVCGAGGGRGAQHEVPSSMSYPLTLPDSPKARPTFAHGIPNQHFYWLISKYEWTINNHHTFEESLKHERAPDKERK